jgi:hypothetical protein
MDPTPNSRRRLEPISGASGKAKDFDLRIQSGSNLLGEYNAISDPYCPLTHSKKFLARQTKQSRSFEFLPTMRPMENPLPTPIERFPKVTVPNTTIETDRGFSGMTYSVEAKGETVEGLAELEVLKSVLNREGYLTRLAKTTRSLGKSFDPMVADLMDFNRVASIDVIEKIIKVCHDLTRTSPRTCHNLTRTVPRTCHNL